MLKDQWFTSSFTGHEPSCVEVYFNGETVKVRDTKDRDGGTLEFTRKEWTAFVSGVRCDEFDL